MPFSSATDTGTLVNTPRRSRMTVILRKTFDHVRPICQGGREMHVEPWMQASPQSLLPPWSDGPDAASLKTCHVDLQHRNFG